MTRVLIVVAAFLILTGVVIVIWWNWLRSQSTPLSQGELTREGLIRAIHSRYQKRFWVSFALYSVIMLLALVGFYLLKDSRIWYADDPWFGVLFILKEMFPYLLILIWAAGAVVLLFVQWRKSSSDIVGLIDSISQMQTGEEGSIITVPENLRELQPVLQEMFNTSLKERRAASEAERRKSELILYLAHDLRTPLTSVVGYLSLLKDSPDLSAEQKAEYLNITQEKALRLETLIEQFFEISRFELQSFELVKTAFSLNILLAQMVDEFFPLLEQEGKTIELSASENLELSADADRLARVFGNILRNALAYSDSGSTIKVNARRDNNVVVVSITNEGATIPPEKREAIFEKFYRLDTTRATEDGGAGLGLAIAKEIVQRHRGTITVESSEGTTSFIVALPG